MCHYFVALAYGDDGKQAFDIPQGLAIDSIKEVAHQSGVDIVFDPRVARTVKTPAILGTYSPRQALEMLLAGTPLVVIQDLETTAFAVRRESGINPSLDDQKELVLKPITDNQTKPKMNYTINDKLQISQQDNLEELAESKRSWFKNLVAILAIVAAGPPTSVNAQGEKSELEVYDLSPFTIESTSNVGYQATATLAGTRINTELRDLANSITVATQEFMEDLQVTDATNLLPYLGNIETAGIDGTYGGVDPGGTYVDSGGPYVDYVGINRNPDGRNRIRGLARGESTRNYLPSSIKFDSYNTEYVTVNRGPNSTLFGLGSPGGVIDNSTISPRMIDSNKVSFTYSSFGSYRSNFDIDRVIIEDKVGFRLAGLWKKHRWRQNFSYEDDDRLTAALLIRPFPNANLKISYEAGRLDARRPRPNAPADGFTRWFTEPWAVPENASGKLEHNPHALLNFGNSDPAIIRALGEWFAQPGTVYENTNPGSGPQSAAFVVQAMEIGNHPDDNSFYFFRSNGITNFAQWSSSATFAEYTGRDDGAFFGVDEIIDRNIFDWVENLVIGPNKNEWESFHAFNASYDQTWRVGEIGNVGVEATVSDEEVERSWFALVDQDRGYQITIDLNTHHKNGELNQNFGRPLVAGSTNRNQANIERRVKRGTAFYELDFKETESSLGWLFGRHVGTLFGQEYTIQNRSLDASNRVDPDYLFNTKGITSLTSGVAQARTAIYVGTNFANDSAPLGGQGVIHGAKDEFYTASSTGSYYDPADRTWKTHPVTIQDVRDDFTFYNIITGNSFNRTVTDSFAYIHQWYVFGQEWLVGTYGYRDDRVLAYGSSFPTIMQDGEENTNGRLPDNTFRWRERFIDDEPTGEPFEQPTESIAFVAHVPDFVPLPEGVSLSLHWGDAENFQIGTVRMTVFDDILSPPSGSTVDQGFTLGLFDDTFLVKVNFYESVVDTAFDINNNLFTVDDRIIRYNSPEYLAEIGYQGPPQFYRDLVGFSIVEDPAWPSGYSVEREGSPLPLGDTQQSRSEGTEIELIYNPTDNWRIFLNVSQQKATRSQIGPASRAYFQTRQEWFSDGPIGDMLIDGGGIPLRDRAGEIVANGLNANLAREGQFVSELREWRANLITNYDFDPLSKLKGWSVGGAYRYEDRKSVGYPIIKADINGSLLQVPDLANPYWDDDINRVNVWIGYRRQIFDGKVTWRGQLNLNNIFSDGEILVTAAQPDGSIRSVTWSEGRTFQLRSIFEF